MKMNIDDAAELLAGAAIPAMQFNRTPVNVVMRAADLLRKEYAELIATLSSEEEWSTRLAAWGRLNIPPEHAAAVTSDVFAAQAYLETGLVALIESGTLVPVITTKESEQDMIKLRRSVSIHNLIPRVDKEGAAAEVEPEPAVIDPIDVCVTEFRSMPSTDFRKKYLENAGNRKIYDSACQAGRI